MLVFTLMHQPKYQHYTHETVSSLLMNVNYHFKKMFLDLQMSIKCPISKTKCEQEAAAHFD